MIDQPQHIDQVKTIQADQHALMVFLFAQDQQRFIRGDRVARHQPQSTCHVIFRVDGFFEIAKQGRTVQLVVPHQID